MTFAQAIEEIIEFENQTFDETPMHVTQIKIEWSESGYFQDGQIFTTVKSFERTMRIASNAVDMGYDKTKYTVTWSNGEVSTYRTDAGDPGTRSYDFYAERKQYREYYLAHPEHMRAIGEDEKTLRETLEALKESEKYQRQIES